MISCVWLVLKASYDNSDVTPSPPAILPRRAFVKAGGERSSKGFATVVGHSTASDDFKLATDSIVSRSYLGT